MQFWTVDCKIHVLSSTIEQVYNAFFYSPSTHLICQQSVEILFSHFVTTLNVASESKLALEDEGYESGSKKFSIPTPLRRISKIYHISSVENASFVPDPVMPCSTGTRESHHRPVCRCVTHSSSEEDGDTPTDEKKKRTSIQSHGMMNIGIWKKFLIDIYVSMNIHHHMDNVHIHVHIQITKHHHTMTHWI